MTRILFDAFFHMMPGHRIGRDIAVGGYRMNFGRYSPGDCYHPNGLAFLEAELAKDYEIRLLRAPYSMTSLYDADILLVTNPDYPLYEGASPWRWEPEDVDALLAHVERGGGAVLLINSFLSKSDFWEENFDIERVNVLMERLGIRWDANYMSDDKFIEKAQAGRYQIGYGQGGRVADGKLAPGMTPLITYKGQVYGFTVGIGKGALAVIGDTGMLSNGLMTFPGFENAAFARDLFSKVTPAWCHAGIASWDYRRYGHLSGGPSKDGLSEETLRALRPKANWQVDHHYRHMTWDQDSLKGAGEEVWNELPVSVQALKNQSDVTVSLPSISLDTDRPGRALPITLTVSKNAYASGTEIHAIGQSISSDLRWSDLSESPERFHVAGQVERVQTVFDLRLITDPQGLPTRCHWRQGQFLFARNPTASHYGYEILLASSSGVIVPRA